MEDTWLPDCVPFFLFPATMSSITANVAALIKMGLRDRPFETSATCLIRQGAKSGLPARREKDESD